MPDRASTPVYDKCTSCAFASEHGSPYEPWPLSHTDVCCLHKFNTQRQEQSALCQLKDKAKAVPCKDCPCTPIKLPQLQVELPVLDHPTPSTDADVPQSCTSVHSGSALKKRSRIAPRKRRGFTKLTIEIRPPRFKKKLWFGTWQEEEIPRAKDAINYYMGSNEPFILPDSPLIFAQHPLGIEYRELKPSCEEFIQVGPTQVRASVYFARRVKEVIKAVTRGAKLKKPGTARAPRSSKPQLKSKPGGGACDQTVQNIEATTPISTISHPSTPMMSFESCESEPSSSAMPCASGNSQFSSGDDSAMVWYGASSHEANSELAVVPAEHLPPSSGILLPYEGEMNPIESDLFSLWRDWSDEGFSLDGITFLDSSPESVAAQGEGENGLVDDNGFTAFLWS